MNTIPPRIERRLPARAPIAATLRLRAGYRPSLDDIERFLDEHGLSMPLDSLSITHDGSCYELKCLIFAEAATRSAAMNRIAVEMADMAHIERFTVTHSSRA